jgi:hypothetical protein
VAELVDALDLGSSGATRESSSLSFRTTPGFANPREIPLLLVVFLPPLDLLIYNAQPPASAQR